MSTHSQHDACTTGTARDLHNPRWPGLVALFALLLVGPLLPATAEAQCPYPAYPVGCCDGNVAKQCFADSPYATDCAANGLSCVWSSASAGYVCGEAGTNPMNDPSGAHTRACPICTPNCTGLECGEDGCGGSCGDCPGSGWCNESGQCECTPDCTGKSCGDDGCGGSCGTCTAGMKCNEWNECEFCQGNCSGRFCGDDGCGRSCGSCWPGTTCTESTGQCASCTANCTGKQCGSDGCGGTCGNCPNFGTCSASGQCQACVPSCSGKQCGDDGCGGVCGTCTGGKQCSGSGQCVTCTPNCSGKSCGDDGCGGSCGTCTGGKTCSYVDTSGNYECVTPDPACSSMPPAGCCQGNVVKTCTGSQVFSRDCTAEGGTCGTTLTMPGFVDCQRPGTSVIPSQCPAACTPNCSGKECGDDGCGGTCGLCLQFGNNRACENNQCVCRPDCTGRKCGSDGCGGSCGTCTGTDVCSSWGACVCPRQCDGKSCGPDGCGGVCGTCSGGKTCTASGQCQACIPQCSDDECGSDGCGGVCGTCGTGEVCNTFPIPGVSGEDARVCTSATCTKIPSEGCCEGEVAQICSTTGQTKDDCAAKGKVCGWDSTAGKYACVASTSVNASQPRTCPGKPACVPSCTGKSCGSDGCGGTCGTCGTDKKCNASGQCISANVLACGDLVNGADCCLDATTYVSCDFASSPYVLNCTDFNANATCGMVDGSPQCVYPHTTGNKQPWTAATCPANKCVPRCGPEDYCGDDGCGGTCGRGCGAGQRCTSWTATGPYQYGTQRYCEAICTPNCTGKVCGSDGCGGSCGTCTGTDTCGTNGQCQACVPKCSGKVCGPDGCGGTCGTCGQDAVCDYYGTTCHQPCTTGEPGAPIIPVTGCCTTATHEGKSYAVKNHCQGGRDGRSPGQVTCDYGCGIVGNEGYARCLTYSEVATAAPSVCRRQPCTPSCTGKTCGSDGCGGTCGTCSTGNQCNASGTCEPIPCGAIGTQGKCNGTQVQYCVNGGLRTETCDSVEGGICGWNAGLGGYSCGTDGAADPSGTYPRGSTDCRCGSRVCGTLPCQGQGESCGSCQAGLGCSADGVCERGNLANTCEGRCGKRVEGWSCQCDAGCVARGDCCNTYGYYCAENALQATTCGDRVCTPNGGETCATCPTDCGACNATTGFGPPWNAPYPQVVVASGTGGQRAEVLANPLDEVLPSAPPYPLDGLVAYVPHAGAMAAGQPTAQVVTGMLKAGGTVGTPTGALGRGIGLSNETGTTAQPTWGSVRVIPDGSLPRKESYVEGEPGGFSVAFWLRVPTSAPDVVNPLFDLEGAYNTTASYGLQTEHCASPRAQDTSLTIACPTLPQLNVKGKVQQVKVYYGSATGSRTTRAGSCGTFASQGADGACTWSGAQEWVEKACLGKESCKLNLSDVPPGTCGGTGRLLVRAVCGTVGSWYNPSLTVGRASEGNTLALRLVGDTVAKGTTNVKDGAWHHVALTFHPYSGFTGPYSAGTTTLYVDGRSEFASEQTAFRTFVELQLGQAPKNILGQNATTPSNGTGEELAGIAQFDEVFLYDRALSEAEVVSLERKRTASLVRVWPTTTAQEIAGRSAGVTGGKATAAVVEATHLLDPGATKAKNQNVTYRRQERALGLGANVRYEPGATDAELSAMSQFTFAGWVRTSALTANKSLLQLKEGNAMRLDLRVGTNCAGRAIVGELAGATAVAGSNCAHGLAANEWAFVVFTQDRTLQRVFVDGHEVGRTTLTSSVPLFNGNARVSFTAGDGVDLFWAGLFERAVGPEELELWRGQGPTAWFDGQTYAEGGTLRLRDYARFHNNGPADASADVTLLNPAGAAPTGTGAAGMLTLKKTGAAGDLGEVRVKATGRFRTVPGTATTASPQGGLRPFSFATRVRVPVTATSTIPLVRLDFPAQGTVPALFEASLSCTRSTTVTCELRGAANTTAGRRSIVSERATTSTVAAAANVDFDVAFSFDGTAMWASMGSPGLLSGDTFDITLTAATAVSAATGNEPPVFRLRATGATAETVAMTNVRLYGRALSPVELRRLTRTDCAALGCDATLRACVQGSGGALAACGSCVAGAQFVAAGADSACIMKRPFLAECTMDNQCATGLCGLDHRCALTWSTATTADANRECKETCFALGRECVKRNARPQWGEPAYRVDATCSSTCRTGYVYPGVDDPSIACPWTPSIEDGDVCTVDAECYSGACITTSESAYGLTFNGRTDCTGLTNGCPGWTNTTTNQPFQCSPGKYIYACPAYATPNPTPVRARCGYRTQQLCADVHMTPVLTRAAGELKEDRYSCNTCTPETFQGKPLWVKAYKWMSPQACALVVQNWTKRGIERRSQWEDLWNEPTARILKRYVLDKEGAVTPAEWAQMEKLGVGAALLGWEQWDETEKARVRKENAAVNGLTNGWFHLRDCFIDAWQAKDGETSLFFDADFNRQVCVANKFPNGTQCPPPGANVAADQGDQFCDSGFCARDTKVCETGFGRLEEGGNADRNDNKGNSSGNDLGPIKLTQTNNTVMEVRKNGSGNDGADMNRTYSIAAGNSYGVSAFGSPTVSVMDFAVTMTSKPTEGEAEFDSHVYIFGVEIPQSGDPVTGCPGASFENGTYEPPEEGCHVPKDPAELTPAIPVFQLCIPSPGGCKENKQELDLLRPSKVEKGPLCLRKISLVGPVPITVEASFGIDVCIGIGTVIDTRTYEPSFQVRPSIGFSLDLRGGVGGEIGPIEVFAGVRAVITIVELAFPIKWALEVAGIETDSAGRSIEDMWRVRYYRKIDLELTILKLAASLFAEVGVAIFKVEWDQIIFEFGGIVLTWDLDTNDIMSVKVDFQHRTANLQ